MDDEIQSCKTHSEYTQSYQVTIPVSFVFFHSKSFRMALCWVHSHWKTTVDLFNAQHSIQFACTKRSFISARVLISTFDGSTSSSRMTCWVCTLTVKGPLLHQTNHAVPSEWWYKQQHYVPFVHQSAKSALKADKIKPYNVSSFNDKLLPHFSWLLHQSIGYQKAFQVSTESKQMQTCKPRTIFDEDPRADCRSRMESNI